MKFVTLHRVTPQDEAGRALFINAGQVSHVKEGAADGGPHVVMLGGNDFEVSESYDEVTQMLNVAAEGA